MGNVLAARLCGAIHSYEKFNNKKKPTKTNKTKPTTPNLRPLFLVRDVVGLFASLPNLSWNSSVGSLGQEEKKSNDLAREINLCLLPSPALLNLLDELCDSMADGRGSTGEGDLAHARVDRAWCTWGGTLGSDPFSISSDFRGAELWNCTSKDNYIKWFPVWRMQKESYR